MEDNPFAKMVDAFTPEEGAPALVLGLVTALSPLRVLCEGNTLEGDDLLCNAALLAVEDPFTTGDKLLMAAMDERQRYVIICKVVSL